MSREGAVFSPVEEAAAAHFARRAIQPHALRLRRLRTPWEIARIAHLRRDIALPAGALADPGFASLEKKGMKPGSSFPSNAADSS